MHLLLLAGLVRMKVVVAIVAWREPLASIPGHQLILSRPKVYRTLILVSGDHIGTQDLGPDPLTLAFVIQGNIVNVEVVASGDVFRGDNEAY